MKTSTEGLIALVATILIDWTACYNKRADLVLVTPRRL